MADTDPCIRIEEPVASPAGKHDPEELLPQIQLRIPPHWYISSCKAIEVISGVVAVYLQWGEHEVIKSQFSQEAIFRIREQVTFFTFFTNFTKDFTKNTKGEWLIVTDQEMHRELYQKKCEKAPSSTAKR